MPKKYPDEFKVKAIRRYEKGESIQSLCQELHISQSTLYHWRREYCSIQTATHTYTPKEFDSITRRLQKAEHKLEIIQLSGYLSKVPLQDRIATLDISILNLRRFTAFMSCARHWMLPEAHFIIIFSVVLTAVNMKANKHSLH